MALKDNIKFLSLQNEVENSFQKIINDKLDSKKKIIEIEKLLKIDNTNENLIFEYLKLQKEILSDSKDDSLERLLIQYECCVEEKKFNQTFQIKKISYKKRIIDLILLIKEYKGKKELDEQINILEKINSEKAKQYHNLIPVNYNTNLELYFHSFYYYFYGKILNLFENNHVNEDKIKSIIQNCLIERTKLLFLKNNNQQNDKSIEILDKKVKYIPYIYGSCNKFLKNISQFLIQTHENFCKRFEFNKLNNEKELLLFSDFLFFLTYYEFEDHAPDYVNIWNDTLIDIKMDDKLSIAKTFSLIEHHFTIENDKLLVEIGKNAEETYQVDNIDDYSFIPLVNYLFIIKRKPDLIELNQFLKIDRYMDKLYIRKIWDVWQEFLIKIFSSNLVKSLFNKIFNNINGEKKLSPHYFFDESEIKPIINNIRYYIFHSGFDGMTLGRNLSVYVNGDPYFIKNNAVLSKLAYLSNNVQSNLHEIIGHLNIRFQFYLSKDKRYESPKPKKPSKLAKSRNGKESGEFVEELLFGIFNERLELEQMLYILDIKNYNKSIDEFREDFIKCGKNKGYDIYPEYSEFLLKLGVDSKDIDFNYDIKLCFLQRHKNIDGVNGYGRHPAIGYDEIYEIVNDNLV